MKRFEMDYPDGYPKMIEAPDGEWVQAEEWKALAEDQMLGMKQLEARVAELEANLLDFVDAGAGNSIDLAWHRRAFDRARQNLNR